MRKLKIKAEIKEKLHVFEDALKDIQGQLNKQLEYSKSEVCLISGTKDHCFKIENKQIIEALISKRDTLLIGISALNWVLGNKS